MGNQSQNQADVAFLFKYRNTKTTFSPKRKTEVAASHLLKFLLASLRCDTFHQGNRVIGLENLGFQLAHTAIQT